MQSNVDPTVPIFGTPTTESVRRNFQIIHDEITALQAVQAGGTSMVLNVRDFGAIGDGIHDDWTAINTAVLRAAATVPLGGGVVYYPPGIYLVSQSIPDLAHVYQFGAGPLATQVQAGGNFPVFTRNGGRTSVINGGGVSSMTIRGFWNQNPATNQNSQGIYVGGANRAIYRDLRFFSCYIGMEFTYNWQTYLENCSVDGQGTDQSWRGYQMDDTQSAADDNAIIAVGCGAYNCFDSGFELIRFNGSKFTTCEAGSTQVGWRLGRTTTGDTTPVNFGHFVNCLSDSNTSDNWSIVNTGGVDLEFLQFSNCWSGNSGGHGWTITGGIGLIFDGCNSDSSVGNGWLFSGCQNCILVGSRVTAPNRTGAGFAGVNLSNSSNITVVGNYITSQLGGRSLDENGTSNFNNVVGNQFPAGCQVLGAGSNFTNNPGFRVSNTGNAVIIAGNTFVTVNHGLGITPVFSEFALIPGGPGTGLPWVSSITSTQFNINIPAVLGANASIGWQVFVNKW